MPAQGGALHAVRSIEYWTSLPTHVWFRQRPWAESIASVL